MSASKRPTPEGVAALARKQEQNVEETLKAYLPRLYAVLSALAGSEDKEIYQAHHKLSVLLGRVSVPLLADSLHKTAQKMIALLPTLTKIAEDAGKSENPDYTLGTLAYDLRDLENALRAFKSVERLCAAMLGKNGEEFLRAHPNNGADDSPQPLSESAARETYFDALFYAGWPLSAKGSGQDDRERRAARVKQLLTEANEAAKQLLSLTRRSSAAEKGAA